MSLKALANERRAASGEFEGDDPDRAGGDRPVSLAIASIGSIAKRVADDS